MSVHAVAVFVAGHSTRLYSIHHSYLYAVIEVPYLLNQNNEKCAVFKIDLSLNHFIAVKLLTQEWH